MGFSLSAATAIIGVGVFLSVQYMVSDVIPSMTDTHDSLESMRDRAVDQKRRGQQPQREWGARECVRADGHHGR